MRGRLRVTIQRKPRDILYFQFDRLKKPRYVAFEEGDRNPIAIEHSVHCKRRELRSRRKDAGEIQWIGTRNRNQTVVRRTPPDRAQGCHCFGKSKLLAREAGDETSASDLAARLELAIDAQEIAPSRQPRSLALKHAHEHDAVAAEQRKRDLLNALRFMRRHVLIGARALDERPSAGGCQTRAACAAAVAARGGGQRTQGPAKLSEMTCPAATSSASASSTCVWRRCVPSTISSKKEAPFSRMNSATFAALALTCGGSSATDRAQMEADLRGNRLIGVDFSGAGRLALDLA